MMYDDTTDSCNKTQHTAGDSSCEDFKAAMCKIRVYIKKTWEIKYTLKSILTKQHLSAIDGQFNL